MASSSSSSSVAGVLPLFVLLFAAVWAPLGCRGGSATFVFDLHHRFSDTVRRWAESRSWPEGEVGPRGWPEKGSVEYYTVLVEHDRVLRGRGLAGADPALTFSDGNETIRINTLGFLHYAEVSLGTPSTIFLVALDTGSDLFWVPCDCKSCARTSSEIYGINGKFNIYSPNASLTSKSVPCNSSLCDLQSQCSGAASLCPYKVAYVSADTSSSGVLVQDVLHLITEDTRQEVVEAQIILGCGRVQTGSFLDSAAPNGLFGLGMEKISVPSILARAGLTSDSFSMCFGRDGIGRISFGDKGSSDQEETPFNLNGSHPAYNVSVTGMQVGNSSIAGDFSALVDSGTSFTYLADPAYTRLSEIFNSQIPDKRRTPDSKIPFEYCYLISSNETVIPPIGLTMKGGSVFPVSNSLIIISTRVELMYCLAVVKSSNLNIIGQNFLTGLRIVFDREKLVLGWKKFNCYDVEDSNTLPINPRNSSAPPPATTVSVGPNGYNPEAAKETRNNSSSQIPVLSPSSGHYSSRSYSFRHIVLLLCPLFLVVP